MSLYVLVTKLPEEKDMGVEYVMCYVRSRVHVPTMATIPAKEYKMLVHLRFTSNR